MSTPWPTREDGSNLFIHEMTPELQRQLIAEASARSRAKVRAGRIGSGLAHDVETFDSMEEARGAAARANSKPYTPFYFWAEEA